MEIGKGGAGSLTPPLGGKNPSTRQDPHRHWVLFEATRQVTRQTRQEREAEWEAGASTWGVKTRKPVRTCINIGFFSSNRKVTRKLSKMTESSKFEVRSSKRGVRVKMRVEMELAELVSLRRNCRTCFGEESQVRRTEG